MDENQALQKRLKFIGLDEEAKQAVRALSPVLQAALPQALDQLYEKLKNAPESARSFPDATDVDAARKSQLQHWRMITGANLNEGYVEGAQAIGSRYAQAGLEPQWYVGGYALVIEKLDTRVNPRGGVAVLNGYKPEQYLPDSGVKPQEPKEKPETPPVVRRRQRQKSSGPRVATKASSALTVNTPGGTRGSSLTIEPSRAVGLPT